MNPVDLLAHQPHITRTLHSALPDAPLVAERPRRRPLRRAAARATANLGTLLLQASRRLQPPELPSARPRLSAHQLEVSA